MRPRELASERERVEQRGAALACETRARHRQADQLRSRSRMRRLTRRPEPSVSYAIGPDQHIYMTLRDGDWLGWFRLGRTVLVGGPDGGGRDLGWRS